MSAPETGGAGPAGVRHRVEHVDTDASGVVHFSRYASLIETGALEKLEGLGVGLGLLESLGLDLRVSELRIRYVAPARFRDLLLVEARIERVGAASVRLSGSVFREGGGEPVLLARGELNLAVVDKEKGTATYIPDSLISLLGGGGV